MKQRPPRTRQRRRRAALTTVVTDVLAEYGLHRSTDEWVTELVEDIVTNVEDVP